MSGKIDGRVQVDLLPYDFDSYQNFNKAAMSNIFKSAEKFVTEDHETVWVEVQYRDPRTGEWDNWDEVGDAVEIDFSDGAPRIRTLTSEEWAGASK